MARKAPQSNAAIEMAEALERMENVKVPAPKLYSPLGRRAYYASSLLDGSMSEKEMRSEYSRLRHTANKRLKRIVEAGYRGRPAGEFKKLSELTTEQIAFELASVVKFLESKQSSVVYKRARHKYEKAAFEAYIEREKKGGRSVERLRDIATAMETERGYEDIGEFWRWVDMTIARNQYDSGKLLKLYDAFHRRHISFSDLFGEAVTYAKESGYKDEEVLEGVRQYYVKNVDIVLEKMNFETVKGAKISIAKATGVKYDELTAYARRSKKK